MKLPEGTKPTGKLWFPLDFLFDPFVEWNQTTSQHEEHVQKIGYRMIQDISQWMVHQISIWSTTHDSIFFDGPPELVVVQSDQACHFRDTRFNRSLLLTKKLRQLTVPQFLPHYNMGAHPHFHRNPHIEWLVITVIDPLTSPYARFYSRVFVQHPSEFCNFAPTNPQSPSHLGF